MTRCSKYIITVLALLLPMSFSLLAHNELTPIITLLDQAQSALEDNDLGTAQSLLVDASTLITRELEATCDTLFGARILLDHASSTEDVLTVTALLTSAKTLIASWVPPT